MTDKNSKVSIVIRGNNEASLNKCEQILSQQNTLNHQVVLHSFQPLERSLYENLKFGLDNLSDLLLVIDADVLLYRDSLSSILAISKSFITEEIFRIEFFIDDYLTGEIKRGGVKVYNGMYIESSLKQINLKERKIRPENALKEEMSERYKLSSLTIPLIIGVHDHFQSLEKISRTLYNYRNKFRNINIPKKISKQYKGSLISIEEYLAGLLGYYSKERDLAINIKIIKDIDHEPKLDRKILNRKIRLHFFWKAVKLYPIYIKLLLLRKIVSK